MNNDPARKCQQAKAQDFPARNPAKLPFVLLCLSFFLAIFPPLFADDTKKQDSTDGRLDAIEQKLSRIESLLRASAPVARMPNEEPGRIRVTILGEVNSPGVYVVDPNTPLDTLIALARGYMANAASSKISITHGDGTIIKVDGRNNSPSYKLKGDDIVKVSPGSINW